MFERPGFVRVKTWRDERNDVGYSPDSEHKMDGASDLDRCLLSAAGIGALMTTPALREWYPRLNKQAWTPPNLVFGPVWTLLYASMGFAAWMVWLQRSSRNVTPALSIFVLQLILNVAWSGLFFGLHLPGAGLLAIVVLWCAIAATIVSFRRAVALAGWILVPYLAWVSFALALNFDIWRLNK